MCDRFTPGAVVTAYVNPGRPTSASLVREVSLVPLFFVLMRGPNDAILKFPFDYKVTFCLYDQTPQQRHIIE